jgi:hypothetical protein
MKLRITVFSLFLALIGSAQTANFGMVSKAYFTTIYNPLDSNIFYQIHDSTVIRLAKTNPTTCYVENVGNLYLKDEVINMTGSTINTVDSTFIFIGESKMHRLRLSDGAILSSVDLFNPLANPTEQNYFNNFIFNQSDTTIYGLATRQNGGVFGNYLAKANPITGIITEISTTSVGQSILMAGATIDPYQMVYYFSDGIGMVGIDLYNGSIYSNTTVVFPPTFTQFGNFAYSCANNTIYGLLTKEYTSIGPDPFDPGTLITLVDSTNLFLGTIDPTTGQVSSVGSNPIVCSSMYLMNSGGAIDPTTMAYYFNDAIKYIGVSLTTGLVESSCVDNYEDGDQFILFRNNTNCVGASFIRVNPFLNLADSFSSDFNLYPNPTKGDFTIQSSNEPIHTIEINTIDGHVIQRHAFENASNKTAEINELPQGVYLVNINATNFHKIVVN